MTKKGFDFKHWLLVLIFLLLTSALLFSNSSLRNQIKDIENGKAIYNYWSCNDGCFYAICKDAFYYPNETCSVDDFKVCANKCLNKFMMPIISEAE